MTTIATIAAAIAPVTEATTGGEVYDRFELEPDTLAIAVVDADQAPIGLIERGEFMLKMGSAYQSIPQSCARWLTSRCPPCRGECDSDRRGRAWRLGDQV